MLIEKEPNLVYELVDQYILPHLDDVTMAKLALGKNWQNGTQFNRAARTWPSVFV